MKIVKLLLFVVVVVVVLFIVFVVFVVGVDVVCFDMKMSVFFVVLNGQKGLGFEMLSFVKVCQVLVDV